MKAFIVSYFGDRSDLEKRKRRSDYHQIQLDWLFEEGFEPSDIKISYRDYDEEEFVEGIEYIEQTDEVAEKKLPMAWGRNALMSEYFWDTDDDWCLMLDNDAILDPRNKGNIISWLRSGGDLDRVDAFCPVNPAAPGKGAFNRLWEDHRIEDNWIFQRGELKGTMLFIKNFRKHYDLTLEFDDGDRCECSEDYFFGFDMVKLGLNPMWCNNILLKELATSAKDSMTWLKDGRSRQDYQLSWKSQAEKEYGMEFDGKSLKKSKFYDKHQVPREIVVPKDEDSGLLGFL